MKATRVKRVGALLVGLSLVAAACGSDDDGSATTEATETTDEMVEETTAPETTDDMTEETTAPETTDDMVESETVQAAPTCVGEADGVLAIATVLPETGNLAFLGPPEFAGAELAIEEINEAGGALGADVTLDIVGSAATIETARTATRTLGDMTLVGIAGVSRLRRR